VVAQIPVEDLIEALGTQEPFRSHMEAVSGYLLRREQS